LRAAYKDDEVENVDATEEVCSKHRVERADAAAREELIRRRAPASCGHLAFGGELELAVGVLIVRHH
jgi:hypothetical protein